MGGGQPTRRKVRSGRAPHVAIFACVIAGLGFANGCRDTPKPPSLASERASEIFRQRCANCHGERGEGNGPAARGLNPRPADYTDPTWQARLSDEQIADVIVRGGAAVGKSPVMAANADLAKQPNVVRALVTLIRGFKRENR